MEFCRSQGLLESPAEQFKRYYKKKTFDTVGCVCFDDEAATCTSSGGPTNKMPGRIGSVGMK